jgi:hypothetical protein
MENAKNIILYRFSMKMEILLIDDMMFEDGILLCLISTLKDVLNIE